MFENNKTIEYINIKLTKCIMECIHLIGNTGPINLLILIIGIISTTAQAYNMYLYICIILWQLVNQLINIIIKNTLKYPRPNNYKTQGFKSLTPTIYNYFVIHRSFGMPSGHSQTVMSELTFIIFYFKNPFITIISIIQSYITLWQRYSSNEHSINQLAVGGVIGIIIGIAFYKIVPFIISHNEILNIK